MFRANGDSLLPLGVSERCVFALRQILDQSRVCPLHPRLHPMCGQINHQYIELGAEFIKSWLQCHICATVR